MTGRDSEHEHSGLRAAAPPGGTILVVEDDGSVRDMVGTILERAGFAVLLASNGADALAAAAAHDGPIRLVIADIVMPRMSGRELVERLRVVRPDTRALYMSGYEPEAIARHGLAEAGISLLEKPFTPEDALQRVREALT